VHTAPDGSGARAALEATSSSAGWKLCAPSEIRLTPLARSSSASSGVTVSGFASTVTSSAAGSTLSSRASLGRLGEGRRSASEEDRLHVWREHAALVLEFCQHRIDVRRVLPSRPTTVTKSQYPQRCAQNGRWT
jgi:hypothetical protein